MCFFSFVYIYYISFKNSHMEAISRPGRTRFWAVVAWRLHAGRRGSEDSVWPSQIDFQRWASWERAWAGHDPWWSGYVPQCPGMLVHRMPRGGVDHTVEWRLGIKSSVLRIRFKKPHFFKCCVYFTTHSYTQPHTKMELKSTWVCGLQRKPALRVWGS